MSPVTYGPSDINNPRGYPFVGPVPESFWLTKALLFDFDWVTREARDHGFDRKEYPEGSPAEALKHCFRALRSYEIRLSLTSNKKNSEIVPEMARLKVADDFDNMRCFEDVNELKPSSEMHQLSMDMLGVKPIRTVAFETTLEGLKAAKKAGIFCVGTPELEGHADLVMGSILRGSLLQTLENIDRLKRIGMTMV
jgi:putative hydrolase of the HAD superfamily